MELDIIMSIIPFIDEDGNTVPAISLGSKRFICDDKVGTDKVVYEQQNVYYHNHIVIITKKFDMCHQLLMENKTTIINDIVSPSWDEYLNKYGSTVVGSSLE